MAAKGGPDSRILRSKETVLRTAVDMLCEGGLAGLSIDEISARSGVAKTTVYRHWPSRAALLIDACSQLERMDFSVAETGTLRGDLIALCREVSMVFGSREASILPSVMDAAERDKEMAQVFATGIEKMATAFRAVFMRAVKRRELPRNRDVDEFVSSLLGPLVYRRWFARKPITDAFIRKVVDRALADGS
jgi:AcrR family transcriptional regulator